MDKSIQTHGWKIRSNHRPILGEEGHDALVSWLGDEEGERLHSVNFQCRFE